VERHAHAANDHRVDYPDDISLEEVLAAHAVVSSHANPPLATLVHPGGYDPMRQPTISVTGHDDSMQQVLTVPRSTAFDPTALGRERTHAGSRHGQADDWDHVEHPTKGVEVITSDPHPPVVESLRSQPGVPVSGPYAQAFATVSK